MQEIPEEVQAIKTNMEKELGHPLDPHKSHAGSWKLYYVNRSGMRLFYISVIFDTKRWIPKAVSHVLPGSELIDNA